MNAFFRYLLVLLLLGSNLAVAERFVRYEVEDGTVLSGVKRFDGTLPSQTLSILGLKLDKSTFADVRNILGPSRDLPHKYDPHTADSICYYLEGHQNIRLSFFAGWPENPTDKLTSFSISGRSSELKAPCSHTKNFLTNVTTENGLGLGLSQSEVISKLGSPSKVTPEWLIYSFQKYREYSPGERAQQPTAPGGGQYKGEYTYHDLIAHFSYGRLDKIEVQIGGEPDW